MVIQDFGFYGGTFIPAPYSTAKLQDPKLELMMTDQQMEIVTWEEIIIPRAWQRMEILPWGRVLP